MKQIIGLIIGTTVLIATSAIAQSNSPHSNNDLIDYDGFLTLSHDVMEYRESRLISLDEFKRLSEMPDTLVLDTRSQIAYEIGHMKGAVHLNFSDFTDEKLAKVIGNKNKRILIYCNNNFTNDSPPFMLKRAELALNIPTFINLYGYGYENIYELGETISIEDPEIVTSLQSTQ